MAIPGWLADEDVQYWLSLAHSDVVSNCHVHQRNQCAGLAIYRTNVSKLVFPPVLMLPADKNKVFASAQEFSSHHRTPKLPKIFPLGLLLEMRKTGK
jgi:hypothetical protein